MPRRRLNVPLAVGLAVGIVGLGVVSLWIWKKLPKDPKPYFDAAQKYEAQGELDKAIDSYSKAWGFTRKRNEREAWGAALGDLLWITGRENDATNYYAGVLRYYPDSASAQERMVRLFMHRAAVVNSEAVWLQAMEQADLLVKMAPQLPYGYKAAALARYQVGRPEFRKQALARLATLRKLAPDDPVGYFYAAVIIGTKPEREDPAGPIYDPIEAAKLMEQAPAGVAGPTESRWRLYQALFQMSQPPAKTEGLTVEARKERIGTYVEAVRASLAKVTDFSGLDRMEQALLADRAIRWGLSEVAEKVYLGWHNDQASLLEELEHPSAEPAVIAKLMENPESLSGCVRLADLYLTVGKLDKVEEYVDRGMKAPIAEKGLLGEVQKSQQCELALSRCKRLLALAFKSGLRDDFRKVYDLLGQTEQQFGRFAQNSADFQRIVGKAAFHLDFNGIAQRRLETALEMLEQRESNQNLDERVETIVALVDVYRKMDQVGKARDLLNAKLLSNPLFRDRPQVRLLQARSCIDLREFAQATSVLDKVLADPAAKDLPAVVREAQRLQAEVFRQTGQLAKAVALLNKIENNPDSALYCYREGVVALTEKPSREAEALAKFRQALDKDKSYWPAARSIALLEARNNHKAEAEQVVGEFLAANPGHPEAQIVLAGLRGGRGDELAKQQELIEKAETPLQHEIRLSQEAVRKNEKDAAYAHLAAAERLAAQTGNLNGVLVGGFNVAIQFKDLERAQTYLEQLEKRDVDGVGGKTYRARWFYAGGRYSEAIQTFRAVLNDRQADWYTRRFLARALLESGLGQPAEAIDLLRQSIKDNPLDADAWHELVQTLARAGQRQEAWKQAEAGLAQLGSDEYLLRVHLERLGLEDPAKAVEERKQLAERSPQDWQNQLALAELYYGQNQRPAGEALIAGALSKAKEREKAKPEANDRLRVAATVADFYRRQRLPDQGEAVLREYLADHAGDPVALSALADYLKLTARFEQADALYAKVLAEHPALPLTLAAADFYRAWGKPDKALQLLSDAKAQSAKPDPDIHLRLASCLLEMGRNAEAVKAIDEYRKLWPNDPNGDLLEGYLHIRQSQFEQAVSDFDRILKTHPQMALAHYRRAQAIYRASPAANVSLAIDSMQKALDLDPNLLDGGPWMELADWFLQRNDSAQAITIYHKQLDRNPADISARVALIRVLSNQKRETDVDKEVAEALKLYPDVWQFQIEAGNVAIRRAQLERNDAARKKLAQQAEACFRSARALAPKAEAPALALAASLATQQNWAEILQLSDGWLKDIGQSARLYLERARAFQQVGGHNEQMYQALEQAVDAANGLPELLLTLAQVLRNTPGLGPAAAEAWLDGYVKRHPGQIGPRLMRAQFLSQVNKHKAAIQDLEALAKERTDPLEQADIRFNMAIIFQEHEQWAEAVANFDQTLKLAGERTSPVVLNNYAYMLADKLGQPKDAIPLAERAVEATNRMDPNVLDTLGWCCILSGQPAQVDKGIYVLEEARRRQETPVIYYHLAYGYQIKMQTDNALTMAHQAEALNRDGHDSATAALVKKLISSLESKRNK